MSDKAKVKYQKRFCGHIHRTDEEKRTCARELAELANAIRSMLRLEPLSFEGNAKIQTLRTNEERFERTYPWPDFRERPPRHHP